ncbi:hypothetical protein FE782_04965 [Paenibacillus antri]|uniref:Uncharacterized protein n=1 Tax=Paenibacillus antri TaxID=2582848 RepID=A0A5R9GNH1_9BACL|nr:GerAB/ArcD/ProY family transporter [Paenibacillus antri]TLS53625.1 hypothetical protein FE782_04965 [Paenibacillus antri]
MTVRDGHIGYREWAAFVLMATGAKILNPSSVVLTQYGKEATWMLSFAAGAVNFAFLFLVIRYMRSYPGKGLLDVIAERSGRWLAKGYAFALCIGMTGNGFINLRLLVDQAKIVTLPQTPVSVMMICSLLLAVYLAYKGIETLSRLSRVLLPWLFGAIVSVAVLMMNRYNVHLLAPWFGPGLPQVAWDGARHALYYGEPFALTTLALFVRTQGDFRRGLWRGTFYALAAATLVIMEVQLILGSPGSERIAFPYLELSRMIYLNRFVQHLEGVYSAIWLLIAFTQIAIDLYLATFLFSQTFAMKRFRPLLLPMAALFMMLALMPSYFYETIVWKDVYLIQIGGAVIYGGFLLAWAASWFRRGTGGEDVSSGAAAGD